jgi:hypothetical protein
MIARGSRISQRKKKVVVDVALDVGLAQLNALVLEALWY